jgi:hypothetical protein
MKSELVELHLLGSHGAAVSRATEAPARLAARVYTSTMVGGAGR